MKLYYSPGACSLAPHIVACELGLKFDLEKVDLKTKKCSDGTDFTKINPKGYVPTLKLDNGEILTEGVVIVQCMADQKSETRMVPKAGTMERMRLQEWLNFISTEIHKGFSPLWAIERMVPNKEGGEQLRAFTKERLMQRIGYVDQALKTNMFLMGSDFTVADAYLYTVLGWAPHVGLELSRFGNVEKYMGRISQRPKVKEAMKAEGLKAT
jgi:glutathione S-transferase